MDVFLSTVLYHHKYSGNKETQFQIDVKMNNFMMMGASFINMNCTHHQPDFGLTIYQTCRAVHLDELENVFMKHYAPNW